MTNLVKVINNEVVTNSVIVAEMIGKDKSTITPLVNKLVDLGYIKKEKKELDKRVTYIILTERGKEIETKFNAISKEVSMTAYKGFSAEEKEIFLRLIMMLLSHPESINTSMNIIYTIKNIFRQDLRLLR